MEANLRQILESAAKPRISIVMQSFLGNYPGSRKDPVVKFMRAVDSFKQQLYTNCELVIVADDCMQTKNLYDIHYKNEKNIRLVLVSRQAKEMSTYAKNEEGQKYFRGFPRQVGVGASTGDLITYMDSDDYLLPDFTLSLMVEFNKNPEAMWWINRSWFDHSTMIFKDDKTFEDTDTSQKREITPLKDKWNVTRIREGLVVMSPWLLMHRPVSDVSWRDTWGGISEDVDFNSRLRQKYKNGAVMDRPSYVRCHFTDKWDV